MKVDQFLRIAQVENPHLEAEDFSEAFIEEYDKRFNLLRFNLGTYINQGLEGTSKHDYDILDKAILNYQADYHDLRIVEKLRIYTIAHVTTFIIIEKLSRKPHNQ